MPIGRVAGAHGVVGTGPRPVNVVSRATTQSRPRTMMKMMGITIDALVLYAPCAVVMLGRQHGIQSHVVHIVLTAPVVDCVVRARIIILLG